MTDHVVIKKKKILAMLLNIKEQRNKLGHVKNTKFPHVFQQGVKKLVDLGVPIKQVANELFISQYTVRKYSNYSFQQREDKKNQEMDSSSSFKVVQLSGTPSSTIEEKPECHVRLKLGSGVVMEILDRESLQYFLKGLCDHS